MSSLAQAPCTDSACPEVPRIADVTATGLSSARTKTAETNVIASVSEINIGDPAVQTVGMDCIWQNIDTTNANAFTTLRKWMNDDVDGIVARIARHVQSGFYRLVALQVSKHSLVVICMCDKPFEEFPAGALDG